MHDKKFYSITNSIITRSINHELVFLLVKWSVIFLKILIKEKDKDTNVLVREIQ